MASAVQTKGDRIPMAHAASNGNRPTGAFLTNVRLAQIRICAQLANAIGRWQGGRACFKALRRLPGGKPLLNTVLGYRRVYPDLASAQLAVEPYANLGHENLANVELHLELNTSARPSDYAAFFHLEPVMPEIKTVYDVGGNAGNLYYCYKGYLDFHADITWTVYDLPEPIASGRTLAAERGESRLTFTHSWDQATGSDLMLISGSLHYFEEPLARRLQRLAKKPRYILINRTPLSPKPTVGAVQDAGDFQVACLLLNRDELVRDLTDIGYELLDQWSCSELSFTVPANPEYDIGWYSGMWLRLKAPPSGGGSAAEAG